MLRTTGDLSICQDHAKDTERICVEDEKAHVEGNGGGVCRRSRGHSVNLARVAYHSSVCPSISFDLMKNTPSSIASSV